MKYHIFTHWDGQRIRFYSVCGVCGRTSDMQDTRAKAVRDHLNHVLGTADEACSTPTSDVSPI